MTLKVKIQLLVKLNGIDISVDSFLIENEKNLADGCLQGAMRA